MNVNVVIFTLGIQEPDYVRNFTKNWALCHYKAEILPFSKLSGEPILF